MTENVHNSWSSCLYFSSRRVTLLLPQLILFVLALGTTMLFSIMVAPICVHASNALGFLFCIPVLSYLLFFTSLIPSIFYSSYSVGISLDLRGKAELSILLLRVLVTRHRFYYYSCYSCLLLTSFVWCLFLSFRHYSGKNQNLPKIKLMATVSFPS